MGSEKTMAKQKLLRDRDHLVAMLVSYKFNDDPHNIRQKVRDINRALQVLLAGGKGP